ncbi:MAG: hypothetical protein ACYCXY_04490 [Acidimicrobiales bacterium]
MDEQVPAVEHGGDEAVGGHLGAACETHAPACCGGKGDPKRPIGASAVRDAFDAHEHPGEGCSRLDHVDVHGLGGQEPSEPVGGRAQCRRQRAQPPRAQERIDAERCAGERDDIGGDPRGERREEDEEHDRREGRAGIDATEQRGP